MCRWVVSVIASHQPRNAEHISGPYASLQILAHLSWHPLIAYNAIPRRPFPERERERFSFVQQNGSEFYGRTMGDL